MMALAIALAVANAPPVPGPPIQAAPTTSALAEDDRWIVLRAREWMDRVGLGSGGGSGWDGDVGAGIRDAAPLPPTDPLIRELGPLLRSVAREAPRGIAPPRDPGRIPDPSWTFAWLDVDRDGRQEIVLAGGTSPAPFYAVLQRTHAERVGSWRILHQAPFRFLGTGTHAGHLYFFGAFDGYGVDGPALAVDRVDADGPGPSSRVRLLFHLPGRDGRPPSSNASAEPCTTIRRTALRSEPRRDDAARDDGLGAQLPGNLFQTIEVGSTGWRLDSTKDPDGQPWTLCFFLAPSPTRSDHPEREMLKPRKLARGPLAAGGHLLVGWVPTADIAQR